MSDAEVVRLGDQYYIELLERRRRAEQAALDASKAGNKKEKSKGTAGTSSNGSAAQQATSSSRSLVPQSPTMTYSNGQRQPASSSLTRSYTTPTPMPTPTPTGPAYIAYSGSGYSPAAPPAVGYPGFTGVSTSRSPAMASTTEAASGLYPGYIATSRNAQPNGGSFTSSMTQATLYDPSTNGPDSPKLPTLPPLIFAPVEAVEAKKKPPKDCSKCCAKGCCCCCIYTSAGKWGIAAALVVLAVGIAVALFFCWPRLPTSSDVAVGTVKVVQGSTQFQLVASGTKLDPTLAADLVVPLTVHSPMMIPITLSWIALNLSYTPPSSPASYQVASGVYPSPTFAAQSNTTLQFPLHVSYASTQGLADPVVQGLLQDCGFLADSGPSTVRMHYDAVAALGSPFNAIKPSFNNNIDVAVCPILASALVGIIQGFLTKVPEEFRGLIPTPDASDPGKTLRKYIKMLKEAANTVGVSTQGTVLEIAGRLLEWAGVDISGTSH